MQQVKKVIKLKKSLPDLPSSSNSVEEVQQVKKVIKLKRGLPVPPFNKSPATLTEEAFEILREYYEDRDAPIPQSDLKWYYEAIEQDKKDLELLWLENPTMKAMIDAVCEGKTEIEREFAEHEAKKKEPKKPESDDPGPMPEYGSKDFWAWCRKRKEIRLAKEAAIVAAGGTVPPPKAKKPKAAELQPKAAELQPKGSKTTGTAKQVKNTKTSSSPSTKG